MPTREEQKARDVAWLNQASVGDEVAVTNTYITGNNPFAHIISNFSGANTRTAFSDNNTIAGMVREFCTITTIRAKLADGYVVDNSVYDINGNQQTEIPVERDGEIEDGRELEKNLATPCVCGHPDRNKFEERPVEKSELCEPTQELRNLAAKLKFNEEVKRLNFRNFSDTKVFSLIDSINEEFHRLVNEGKSVDTLWH